MKYKAQYYYQDKTVAERYYSKRFGTFQGKFNHFLEKTFLRGVLRDLEINSALDVACGSGRLTRELINCRIQHIVATDISAEMIEIARQYCVNDKMQVVFRQGDATRLPFKDNQFDVVISYRFLDHLPVEEKKKAITELVRVSSKYLIFTMANLNTWTRIARRFRKILNRRYYEGSLVDENYLNGVLKENRVHIIKKRLKLPLLAMELMYFCEKV